MIPTYPRVCPDLYYVESESSVTVFTKDGKVNLQSQGIGVVLKALMELADGSNSWEEIQLAFPEHLRASIAGIMELLSGKLIFREGRYDNEFNLAEGLSSTYSSTLNYLRCHLESSYSAFMQFRMSKVLLTGEGPALLTAALNLYELGLENAVVVVKQSDIFYDKLRTRLQGSTGWQVSDTMPDRYLFDLIVSIGPIEFNQEVYAGRQGHDSQFLPITLAQSYDYIGPLKEKHDGACVDCLQNSIHDAGLPAEKGPMVRSLTGARAAWEVLKILAGVEHQNLLGTIAINAEDLSDQFHRIFPRYSCACHLQVLDMPLEPQASWEDLAKWAGSLINSHAGPIRYLDPENVRQLPVNYQVLQWQQDQPRLLIPGRTLAHAKVDGVINGLRMQLGAKPSGDCENLDWQASAGTSIMTWVYDSLCQRLQTQFLHQPPLTHDGVIALLDAEAHYWIKTLRVRYGLDLNFVLEFFDTYQIYVVEISKNDGILHRGTGLTASLAIKEALLKTMAQMNSQDSDCSLPVSLNLSPAHSHAEWNQWYAHVQTRFAISLQPERVLKSAELSVGFVSGWVALYARI